MSYIQRDGIWINTESGEAYYKNANNVGTPSGVLFEMAEYHGATPERKGTLNPLQFATRAAAERVLSLVVAAVNAYETKLDPKHVKVSIELPPDPTVDYIVVDGKRYTDENEFRTIVRALLVQDGNHDQPYSLNCGLIAKGIVMHGEAGAAQDALQELIDVGYLPKLSA